VELLLLYGATTVCALCCVALSARVERSWWLGIALTLFAIAVLRATRPDLWLDATVSHSFRDFGWYDYRRPLQIAVLFIIGAALAAGARFLRSSIFNFTRATRMAIAASALLLVVVTMRASSLHWTDAVFDRTPAGITVSHLAQAIALLVVVAMALWIIVSHGRRAIWLRLDRPGTEKP
jgi:hypothetical protein